MNDSNRSQAQSYLDDAQVAMLKLDALLDADYVEDKSAKVREAHNEIGRALKLADIHAHLAIAESITEAGRPPAPALAEVAFSRRPGYVQ